MQKSLVLGESFEILDKNMQHGTNTSYVLTGTPINKRPVLGYRNLNLFKLFRLVHKLGGFDNVSTIVLWFLYNVLPDISVISKIIVLIRM